MTQNIIYSPWERTKGLWLCLMTTLLLLSLLWLFSFVSTFLTSLIKLILWLQFSTDKRQAGDMVDWGQGPQGSAPFHTEPQQLLVEWADEWMKEHIGQWTNSAAELPEGASFWIPFFLMSKGRRGQLCVLAFPVVWSNVSFLERKWAHQRQRQCCQELRLDSTHIWLGIPASPLSC